MKVSISWLKEYVSVDMTAQDLADALTMAGLEVETVTDRYAYLDTVVAGRISTISPHPKADKLQVCEVDTGNCEVTVVCGAPNIEVGMTAPCALPGTVFPDGNVLKKSIIRGQESEGMLCSEKELGIGPDASGVMVLNDSVPRGEKIAKALALSDTVLEIDLTPNRPDCLGIIGIAREAAAIQGTNLKYPDIPSDNQLANVGAEINDHTSVEILDPDLCPRYAARLIFNVAIGPSPFWIQDRLMSVGMRPINNIVDITNFVMLETGQPLHAFDFDRLSENRIIVRKAGKDKKFTTLDGKDHNLPSETLMICDGSQPVAIGGVMGGLNSEIDEKTTRVLIESALFNPASIRKTAKYIGSGTDASHRFERGVDPEGTLIALNRATVLMAEVSKGTILGGVIDAHPNPSESKAILLDVNKTNGLLGTDFSLKEMTDYLESIDFTVSVHNDVTLSISPPSFRVDISRPEDLAEEIARLSGYDHIPVTFPAVSQDTGKPSNYLMLRQKVKRILTGLGFNEAINYSFISKAAFDRLRMEQTDIRRSAVELMNPLTEDQAVMRTTLVPGLIDAVVRNHTRQMRDVKLFETGKVFFDIKKDGPLPLEQEMLAGVWTGKRSTLSWHDTETESDFYDIKGAVEALFRSLQITGISFSKAPSESCIYTQPGVTAQMDAEGASFGSVGQIHSDVQHNYGLKQKLFLFELNLEKMLALVPDIKASQPMPKFPATSRDITIIIDSNIEARELISNIEACNEKLLETILLFDIYEGKPVPEGKKSVSLRLTYRSTDRTLEDDFINMLHKDISGKLIKAFDAAVPA
jgi:phenylalanyl-tRNA synthetase beta chain